MFILRINCRRAKRKRKDAFSGPGMKGVIQRNKAGEISGFVLDAGRVKNLRFVRKK
jgi:hypothetical protein